MSIYNLYHISISKQWQIGFNYKRLSILIHLQRYGTKEKIHQMIRTGMALSVLFYSDSKTNKTIIGCIISQCSSWYFCILDIYGPLHPIQDTNGYTYFNTELSSKEYEINDKNNLNVLNNHGLLLWSVGIALLCYWSNNKEKYYCFINEDGYSLNISLNWSILT